MKIIYIFGLLVALTPFLGIPTSWKTFIFVVLGLTIFAKGFYLYRKEDKKTKKEESTYEQNDDFREEKNEKKEDIKKIDNEKNENVEVEKNNFSDIKTDNDEGEDLEKDNIIKKEDGQ